MANSQMPGETSELDALFAEAVAHHRAGRLAEAAATYRQILSRQPNLPQVQNFLGVVLCQQRQFDEALVRFERAVTLDPRLADAHNNLGNVLRQQGKLDEAAARYRKAVAIKPDYVEAHNNLGSLLYEQGERELAAARFEKVLTVNPDHVGAHNNLGNILRETGQLDRAATHYGKALALKPDLVEAHNNLGNVLWQQGRYDEAEASFRRALAFGPRSAEAHCNLAIVLTKQRKHNEAASHYQQAIALKPDFVEAHNGLGFLLAWHGRLDEALASYQRVLAIAPTNTEALWNLGSTLLEAKRLSESRQAFEQLAAVAPDWPQAQMGLAICHLHEGDFARGWPLYEARLRLPDRAPQPTLPRWRGEPLAGRSLMLVHEQGFGDTIQFIRYARVFRQMGARVVVAVPAGLGPLLASGGDWDELFLIGSADWPACDFFLPIASVPGALGTNASNIPADVPYLSADAQLIETWRQELTGIEGFKIGIAWQGSRDFRLDRWRSIPLAQFAPLAKLPGVHLVNLQKGFGSEQIAKVDFPLIDFADRLDGATGPFVDTAALMSSLDLVISPDTVTAHLAGALGAPVWLALHKVPDWRWQLDRDDCPWYPTMRLFRQTTLGQWSDVFERMAEAAAQQRDEVSRVKGEA